MEIKKFIELDKRGLIPGPGESEEAFAKRAAYCLSLKDFLKSTLEGKIPFDSKEAPLDLSEQDMERVDKQYGIRPDWVPVFFSNTRLTPWHGGCAWIFQMDESSPTAAFLQLRKSFFFSDQYLKVLRKEEVVAHELAHVGRMCFEEPKFEEFLAYQSSSAVWRRYLGPLVQSTWESMLFVFLLFVIFLFDLFLFWHGDYGSYQNWMWLKTIPLVLAFIGVVRLVVRHWQFKKCSNTLSRLISNPCTVKQVLYRLTDQEIISFGSMDKQSLISYIKEMEASALRWRVLVKRYFSDIY
ncbi:hypothetical protein, putative type III secreted [Waddlia chondrophila 2032/99]|uniref:Uncharacterized protein n=2 Tax=Waddlia chondrophila TaxID=71667 RepID=D6YTV1_WADCW|nr:hypothetical protein [Waddlia chondrophila]ADI37562.1 conserved hypothetical protein [Waddlia chondrophila WSU 86-1044]CCB91771.1 hypothetical protein, putative type III secreted [Waddlia chondrophila 2032/99]